MTSNGAIFQRLHPKTYLERFLAENVRPDGRGFTSWRDITVNTGSISTANGSSLVRLGDTTVVCGVKAEIAQPELESPTLGYLVPNLDLPALCSPRFKPGPPSEEAQMLNSKLNDILINADLLDLSTLVIEPAKAVWVLYVDATCINYDGNALDATLIAMVAALMNTALPKATYDSTSDTTICSQKEGRTPLLIDTSKLPISSSFGACGSTLITDPTSFEEPLLDSKISIVLIGSTIVSLHHEGVLLTIDHDTDDEKDDDGDTNPTIEKCFQLANTRYRELREQQGIYNIPSLRQTKT